jgi:Ca2+-binding EF-hand superfamily protein
VQEVLTPLLTSTTTAAAAAAATTPVRSSEHRLSPPSSQSQPPSPSKAPPLAPPTPAFHATKAHSRPQSPFRGVRGHKMVLNVHDIRRSRVFLSLHTLSKRHRAEYTTSFFQHCTNNAEGKHFVELANLRHIVMDLGYYETADEIEAVLDAEHVLHGSKGVTLDGFLHLMGKVSMADLTQAQLDVYERIFSHFDVTNTSTLSEAETKRLLSHVFKERMTPAQQSTLMHEWEVSHGDGLSYAEYLSMIAFTLKRAELDHAVDAAFTYFCGRNDDPVITAKSLRHAIKAVTGVKMLAPEIDEMIWEAGGDKGCITRDEFLHMVKIVYEPGWILLWNYRTNAPVRFLHDLFRPEEFADLGDSYRLPTEAENRRRLSESSVNRQSISQSIVQNYNLNQSKRRDSSIDSAAAIASAVAANNGKGDIEPVARKKSSKSTRTVNDGIDGVTALKGSASAVWSSLGHAQPSPLRLSSKNVLLDSSAPSTSSGVRPAGN